MSALLTGKFGQLSPHTNTDPCQGDDRSPGFCEGFCKLGTYEHLFPKMFLSSASNKSCFFKQLCSVFGLKPKPWSQRDTMTGEGWGTCLKARQNRDVDTEKRVGENGSTSALMRVRGTAVFPAGTQPRTMKIRLMSEWDHLDI